MAGTYVLDTLLNTTSGMDAIINNKKQDDNTVSVTGVDWFVYAGKTVDTIYINGNNWIGFGQSTEQLKVCRRDGAIYYIYRQEGTLDSGKKFLKIRIEGYTYYSGSTDAYALKYEVFLIDDQTLFVNVIQIPANTSYFGVSSITDGTNTKSLDITAASKVPLYILVGNAGASQEVTYELYPGKTYENISIASLPNKISYYQGEKSIDSTGLVVSGTMSDGTVEAIDNYTLSGFDTSTVGIKTITVTFKKCAATFEIEVKEDAVIEIAKAFFADHYLIGESLSVSSITIKWGSGKTQTVTQGYEVSGFDSSSAGTKEITFTYSGISTTRTVYVFETASLKIEDSTKTQYYLGDELEPPYWAIVYSDGYTSYGSISDTSGFDSSTAGDKIITVTVKGLTATYTINVSDTYTVNIGASTDTDIVASLNLLTGVLTLSGTGDTKEISTPSWGSGGLFNDGGEQCGKVKKIIVEPGITGLIGACFYGMKKATSIVLPDGIRTIGEECFGYCPSITEATLPETVDAIGSQAFVGDSDLVLTVLNRETDITDTNSDYPLTLQVKLIKGYCGSTAEKYALKYNVEFEALNKIASISIKQEPYSVQYWPLEKLDTSGLVLEITDEDGVSIEITDGFTVEEPDMETPGEKKVTVKYKEHESIYKIKVAAPSFKEISGNANKMTSNSLSIPWFMFDGTACDKVVTSTDGRIIFSGTSKITIVIKERNYKETNACYLETILDNGTRAAKIRSSGSISGNYGKGKLIYEVFFFSTGDAYITIEGTATSLVRSWSGSLTSNGNSYNIYGPSSTAAGNDFSAKTSCYHKDTTGLTWETKAEEYTFSSSPQKIEVTMLPDKLDYFVGDSMKTDGLEAVLVYSDGKTEPLKDYSVVEPDMTTIGAKKVYITDTETGFASDPFNVYVNLKKEIGTPTKSDILAVTDIRNGILKLSGNGKTEDFDLTKPPFAEVYDYITTVNIESGITVLGTSIFAAISKNTTVTGLEEVAKIKAYAFYHTKVYGKLSLLNAGEIGENAFSGTNIEEVEVGKNIKNIGENAFDTETITNISVKRFKDSVTGEPWGATNATVTWAGTPVALEVTAPIKTEYISGEELDITGMTVTIVCDTGETEKITDYTVSGYDKNALGKQTITVSYRELNATYEINVYSTTTGIRISHYPIKTYYKPGENLDTTGLTVMIVDDQGTERETTKYEVSELDTSTLGAKTISITYREGGENIEELWFEEFQVYVTRDATNPFMEENAEINIIVHWPNGEFEDLINADIVKKTMKLKESICNERYFIWGGCVSNCLTFQTGSYQFWETGEENAPHGDIELYIECKGTKVRLFTGTIDSGKRTNGLLTRTIIAYDCLYKFRNVDIARWYKNQTTDKRMILTQKQFREALFDYLGIEQQEVRLKYDKAYVPNTWASGEMKPIDIIQDLCLQNSVFGWVNRNGKFCYLTVKSNARLAGTSTKGIKRYEYYEAAVHYDTMADDSTEITEGRVWYPKQFLPDPYPGLFSPGDIPAQEAYEANVYYIRDSFFIGNDEWMEYVFDADEYGYFTRTKPIMTICYGTVTKVDEQHLYMAQGYKAKVRGNPLTRVGSTIQLLIRKKTPPFPGCPDGKIIEWKINSYIMSRTMEITSRGIMETYSAENGPYNSNKSQLGKNTQEHVAQISKNRSKLPTISYRDFSSGPSKTAVNYASNEQEIKKDSLKCVKRIEKTAYDALVAAGKTRTDTIYLTYEEE